MKRLCIFAHWDRDKIIDDYVIYYLKALKEVCETIIFVSDCNLETNEINKLDNIADFVIAQKHGEYDFGSYKRGFLFAKEKNLQFDELLLVNDSCYGPFYPLKHVFEKMNKKKCDFWGITQNSYVIKMTSKGINFCYKPHIQTYFILLKPQTFMTFEELIQTVKPEKTKEDVVINYEIGLSTLLKNKGFKRAVYCDKFKHIENCTLAKWDKLIQKYKFPFLKTSIAKFGLQLWGEQKNLFEILPQSYPRIFIENQQKRLGKPYSNDFKNLSCREKFLHFLIRYTTIEVYSLAKLIDRKIISSFCRLFHYISQKF